MRRKLGFIFLVFLFVSITCAACSSSSASPTNQTPTQNPSQLTIPERRFDLQGQVKSIRGNEITVYKVVGEQLELTEEEKAKRREDRQNLSPEEKQQARDSTIKVTDETQAFIVPVGVPIVTSQNIGGKPEIDKMDLADIKQGSLLKVWFKADSNSQEAEFVQIMSNGGI